MSDIVVDGTCETYRGDQIAVDLPHAELVLKNLQELDPSATPCAELRDSEPLLDLGLIALLSMPHTANVIEAMIQEKWGDRVPVRPRPPSAIDTVLNGLRIHMGDKYGGWAPHFGKIRLTDSVGGLPHVGTGGWEYPEATVEEYELRPTTAPEGQGVRIGVIDGKIFPNVELKDRWYALESTSVLPPSPDGYSWLQGHAAFVVGRIVDRAPGARLEVRGLLDGPVPKTSVWELVKAMADFLSSGVRILNLSVGCYTEDGQAPFVLDRAVEVLTRRGMLLIAAAGNHRLGISEVGVKPNAPIFPAACRDAVAVGALEQIGEGRFRHASFSTQAPWVNLVAPGHEVSSTYLSGHVRFGDTIPGLPDPPEDGDFHGLARWSGTSFATGTISGEIARRTSPGHTPPEQVLAELREQDPLKNDGIGKYTP